MPHRFPPTWRVDPEAHYWRMRRPSRGARLSRPVSAIVARFRRRPTPCGPVGAVGVEADGIVRGAGRVRV